MYPALRPNIRRSNPFQEEWIQEWKQALSKSAYPLWEEWFRNRDWECLGHLTVQQPGWFPNGIHIGEIDLQHQLHVKGSTRLQGDLHIHGQIWHHPTLTEHKKDWEFQIPVESYHWNEIIEKSHIQLRHTEGWWTTWDGNQGLAMLQDPKTKIIDFMEWSGSEHPQKNATGNVQLRSQGGIFQQIMTNDCYINKTLQAPNSVLWSGKWIATDEFYLDLQKANLRWPSQIKWNAPDASHWIFPLDFQISAPQINIQSSFNVNQCLRIELDGKILIRSPEMSLDGGIFRCQKMVTYDTLVAPSITIDDIAKIQLAHVKHIQTNTMEISSNHLVSNFNAELWNGQKIPDLDLHGYFVLERKEQVLSNKSLGSNLDGRMNRIINIQDPKEEQDIATKGYVDKMRFPWRIFNGIRTWIPLSHLKQWGRFSHESNSWTGTFHHGAGKIWRDLRAGDLVGVYPNQNYEREWFSLQTGIGIFQLLEHGNGEEETMNHLWNSHNFSWTLQNDFYHWIQQNSKEALWVGGSEGINGGAKLFVIQLREKQELKWNCFLNWEGHSNDQSEIIQRITNLEKRIPVST